MTTTTTRPLAARPGPRIPRPRPVQPHPVRVTLRPARRGPGRSFSRRLARPPAGLARHPPRAWPPPAPPRWPSTAWPTAASTPSTRGRASRHLPAGRLSVGSVALFTAVSSLAFVASTLLFLPNPWPIALSVPVLLWLLGYSFAKRFTSLAHAWLGAGPGAGTGLRLARLARIDRLAARAARAGRADVGHGLRRHLRVPGRRLRPRAGPAEHPRPVGRPGCAPPRRGLPRGDRGSSSSASASPIRWGRSGSSASPSSRPCSSTSTRSSGPTT